MTVGVSSFLFQRVFLATNPITSPLAVTVMAPVFHQGARDILGSAASDLAKATKACSAADKNRCRG